MKQRMFALLVCVASASSVFALGQPPGGGEGGQGSQYMPLLLIGGVFVIMYFLMIRPQQKRAKEKQQMIGAIAPGDKIVTTGGVYGQVKQVKEHTIRLQIDDHTRIELSKSAVGSVIQKGED